MRPLKQTYAEPFLQGFDLLPDGTWRDVQLARGEREAEMARRRRAAGSMAAADRSCRPLWQHPPAALQQIFCSSARYIAGESVAGR
jgi:hypothetical protein